MQDAATVCAQLIHLESLYKNTSNTSKEILAYTVRQYLLLAIEYGNPNRVLDDPAFQTLFMDARLATDCGWRPPIKQN